MDPQTSRPNPGLLRRLGTSINPWFRFYDTPGVWGVLVALFVIVGVVGLTIAGAQDKVVETTETRFEEILGSNVQQKMFIDTVKMDPPDLPANTRREVEMCTLYTTRYKQSGDFLNPETCVWWPSFVYREYHFPDAFQWCTMEQADQSAVKDIIKAYHPNGPHEKSKDMFDLNAMTWDLSFPGFRCMLAGEPFKDMPGNRPEQYEKYCPQWNQGPKDFTYCGYRDGMKIWDDYSKPPPDVGPAYVHGYQITIKTISEVPASLGTAIGASLGYVGYIEFVATALIVLIAVSCRCSKPVHKNASIANVLKGAGLTEDLERLEPIIARLEALEGQAQFSNASAPAAASATVGRDHQCTQDAHTFSHACTYTY